jgi:hypothetical protein
MAALEHSVPQPGAPTGQDKIDMTVVTCKQYSTSDADRQAMIGFWMSGYFRASRNQPIFDFRVGEPTLKTWGVGIRRPQTPIDRESYLGARNAAQCECSHVIEEWVVRGIPSNRTVGGFRVRNWN